MIRPEAISSRQTVEELCQKAVRAMVASELGASGVGRVIGSTPGFIQRLLDGSARLTGIQMRRIEQETGKSVEHWSLLDIDRMKLSSKDRQFLDSTLALFRQFDAARAEIDQFERRSTRPRRPKRTTSSRTVR